MDSLAASWEAMRSARAAVLGGGYSRQGEGGGLGEGGEWFG